MPDRYDPKVSPRGGDRKVAPDRDAPANDDPLAELAKIVSGRTSGARARSTPPPPDSVTARTGADVLGDLENELLSDLQASFATVRGMVNGAQPAALPAAAPLAERKPAPVRAAPPPPPPLPAQQPTASVATPASQSPIDQVDFDLLAAGLAERLAPEPPSQTVPPPSRSRPAVQPDPRNEARPARTAATPAEPRFLTDQVPERIERTRGERGNDSSELSGFRQRASEPSTPPVEPASARSPRSRWDKPEHPASKFAPPKAAKPAKAPLVDDDDVDAYAELLPTDDEIGSDFPLDGFGDLPAEADDTGAYADDLASMVQPRRSRAPFVIASVVGLVVVGGLAVFMFRPGGGDVSGLPPTIVADAAPTKITPEEPAATDAEGSNKLIYDRVNPATDGSETTVLAGEEQAISEVPLQSDAQNAITRVIIPGGPGIDQPADEGLSLDGQPSTIEQDDGATTDVAAGDAADPSSIGPRKVRTVIVKPDGTIVESGATDAATATAATAEPAASEPTSAAPVAQAPELAPEPAPVTDDTAAIAGANANGELAITPSPETAAAFAPAAEEPQPLPTPVATPEPAPAPAPAPTTEPAVAAIQDPPQPDTSQVAPIPAGGMLVQVSSQRTEDAARATFRDLQTRYPNILGPYDVNIQRADIPDRGTFFRVRVGPFSASDAQRLCNDLKAAGGDCILAQR